MKHRTLLLNQGYQPIKAIDWKRALCMFFLEKVDILEYYDEKICSVSMEFQIPAVIRLKKNVKFEPSRIRFSRSNIYTRDKGICQYCGGKFKPSELTLDHVIPKSVGGRASWTNMVACCKSCNEKKANRTPQQAGMRLIQRPQYPSNRDMYKHSAGGEIPEQWNNWIFD